MGDPLSEQSLEAFVDELQKVSAAADVLRAAGKRIFAGGVKAPLKFGLSALGRIGQGTRTAFGGTEKLVDRVLHPIEGLRTGWMESSPLHALGQRAKEMGFRTPQEAAAALKSDPKKLKKLLAGGGEHLLGKDPSAGMVRGTAESLSRSGWTGAGRGTKYLPVGSKSLTVGFAGMGVPGVIKAQKPSPTGEGSTAEMGLGEGSMALANILSTGGGIGMVPATVGILGARAVGSRLGRVIDRMRAGAPVRQAVTAPSPTEAAEQLESIQRYYG